MATPTNDAAGDNKNDGGRAKRKLCGAPFPPRPKAIATFLSSSDFLPGCQTVLHSVKRHLTSTPEDQYPPEIILLLSSKVSNPGSKKNFLLPTFCDRIVRVDHIPIAKNLNENNGSEKTSNENCGWTKLRLFELESYDTILYIDADCLVMKDVSHLLHIDDPTISSNKGDHRGNGETREKRVGLLAAAPDIFPPDKFNAGVMVIRPSKSVFEEMMSKLRNSPANHNDSNTCKSYDGGDTGFLNSFYPGWYTDMPSYSRLPFGDNAQRFMHHCTYDKQPKLWDEAVEDIRIIRYSSSPKPWDKKAKSTSETKDQESLDEKDSNTMPMAKRGKLEIMWQAAYERSQQYYVDELQNQASIKRNGAPLQKRPPTASRAPPRSSAPPARRSKPQNTHSMVQKRYKELRKAGMDTKEAMTGARAEYGLDKADVGMDPSKAVGQMFGLM
eukprot:CAMPEP_0172312300 /NCGR_PEP_ID=MMETSP1058-20130122/17115_1 /TAXON_ID=83371 /ORGANISM="Detonula confervacea, Strain CCMP 353" /LENGTH=441 /DNA_ID=CAMNT_0013025711 /DNA_START=1 /DNA_END=1326 /DNA_ORIENTATION=+